MASLSQWLIFKMVTALPHKVGIPWVCRWLLSVRIRTHEGESTKWCKNLASDLGLLAQSRTRYPLRYGFSLWYSLSYGFSRWYPPSYGFSLWYSLSYGFSRWYPLSYGFSLWYSLSYGFSQWYPLSYGFSRWYPLSYGFSMIPTKLRLLSMILTMQAAV